MKWIALTATPTEKDKKEYFEFAEKEYNRLSQEFPRDFKLENGICYMTMNYYRRCCRYVLENCFIKDQGTK